METRGGNHQLPIGSKDIWMVQIWDICIGEVVVSELPAKKFSSSDILPLRGLIRMGFEWNIKIETGGSSW